jgi:hypothetical protein
VGSELPYFTPALIAILGVISFVLGILLVSIGEGVYFQLGPVCLALGVVNLWLGWFNRRRYP